MDIRIFPGPLKGELTPPASKSHLHRALICAFLSDKPTILTGAGEISGDIAATIGAIKALGARVTREEGKICVSPDILPIKKEINCAQSGSTLRFMLPVAASLGVDVDFLTEGSLSKRPVEELIGQLSKHGCSFEGYHLVSGKLTGGEYEISGNISSQYLSGLLMALPLIGDECEINLTTPLYSKPYADMTLEVLSDFGIKIIPKQNGYIIPGGQSFTSPGEIIIQRDWSCAAVWICAGAVRGEVDLKGMELSCVQGDKKVVELLQRAKADISTDKDNITVKESPLEGLEIYAGDIPDTVPALCSAFAYAQGRTVIKEVGRLKYKESDRLSNCITTLNSFGSKAYETEDSIVIEGGTAKNAEVSSFGDHRMAMAQMILSLSEGGVIRGAQCVDKSYPAFWEDFKALGGDYEEI